MLRKCERYILDVIKRRRNGVLAWFLRGILWLLSWPFRFAVAIRNWSYDAGWLKQYHPPVPVVISIGNIVSGGSGKTPVTMMLAQEFYSDTQIGILTRGYRSLAEKSASPVTQCAGKGPLHSAVYCGDEPFLLSENLPKTFIIVGKDRRKGSNLAGAAGVRLVILEDGMQHRCIDRDFEVIVIDADDPFGQNYFLPRGLLRDHPKSLSRADLIIVNYLKDHETFESLKTKVGHYTKAPIVGTKIHVEGIYDLAGNPIPSISDKKIAIFCGIANPERFRDTIVEMSGNVVAYQFFPDHHHFKPEQIIKLGEQAKKNGAELLICTEKDKVKLTELSAQLLQVPIAWIKVRMQIVDGEQDWQAFLEKIKKDLAKSGV